MDLRAGELRARLQGLCWGEGLTPEEMLAQAPDLPRVAIEQLPPSYRFRDAGEVMSYVHHLQEHGVLPGDPDLSPVQPPRGYGDSPTGAVISSPEKGHGVGSGAGSGYTGSDAQTGDDQRGVDYTDVD